MITLKQLPKALFLLPVLFVFSVVLADEKEQNDIYIAGFVRDIEGNGIRDATVVLTDRHKKLFSIRTHQKGWFETINPLDNSYLDTELRITVIKSGYILNDETSFIVKADNNFQNITMTPVGDLVTSAEYSSYESGVVYGRVVDQHGKPIQGAVITVNEKQSEIPVSSAVSRDSGYFSIYYTRSRPDIEYEYSIEHYVHDSEDGSISLAEATDYLDLSLTQKTYRFSLGPAIQLQTTEEPNDTESGGALLINLSIHREPLIVVNRFIPRYRKAGIIGYDIAIGAVPFRKATRGADTLEYVGVLALGASYGFENFILPLRFGIAVTDTDKVAAYLGLNIPLYYF